jgi:hypothetical protein
MPRRVKLRVKGYGKHTKYGPAVWKFGRGMCSTLLLRAGWTLARRPGPTDSEYDYLSPPAGERGEKSPVLEVAVPDQTEIWELAERLHAAGAKYRGELHGWPVRYNPRREEREHRRVQSLFGESRVEQVETVSPAQFLVGEHCTWYCSLTWHNGDRAPPRRHENTADVLI